MWWQLAIWMRQLLLLCWARLARTRLSFTEDASRWQPVTAWALPALLVLLLAWRLQREVLPFAFPFQNVMEAWLLGSSFLLVVLACFYSALDEQASS